MIASDLTFGIEIECLIPNGHYVARGITASYSNPQQFSGLPEGWLVKTDSSVRSESGYTAIEIVSPVLRGSSGVAQVRAVYRELNRLDTKTNRSCGLHIHVGVPDRNNVKSLQKLVALVSQHERALYASTGSRYRENCQWCQPINNDYRSIARTDANHTVPTLARLGERYRSINIINLAGQTKPTAEFRLFAPTMNITKVLGHLTSALGLVVHAYTTKGSPAYKRSNPKRTGVEALDRLVRVLGYSAKNGGKGLDGLGIGPVEVREIKQEFARLAAKYDRSATPSNLVD